MKHLFCLVPLAFAATLSGHAQIGVYAGFTTSTLDLAHTPRFNGGTFGAYYDNHHFPLVNLGLDLRAAVLPSDPTTSVTSGLAGPRVALHVPLIPLRPYAEGLVGAAHVTSGQGVARYDGTGLATGFAAGADLHILPYIDWRVLDYSYTRLIGPSAYQTNLTTGLVLRIPFS